MKAKRQRRRVITAILIAVMALALAPSAGAEAWIYWWQRNMSPSEQGFDTQTAHNHYYNELYFGPNAGWRSEVWEVTPAGYRHFDKNCSGNCFNAHPAYYYTYVFCANREGRTHFVYDCMTKW